jgi:anaerobic dimethyl sulfoxide reductase subunit A
MRMAKQNGCKFVVIDPQYTDSAAAYDAWWIPINRIPMRAMLAGMAHYIFQNNLQDQAFIDKFVQRGCRNDAGMGKGSGKLQGLHHGRPDKTPKTPNGQRRLRRLCSRHQKAG